jgi:hypothetical protein
MSNIGLKNGDKVTLKGGSDVYTVKSFHSDYSSIDIYRAIPLGDDKTREFTLTIFDLELIEMLVPPPAPQRPKPDMPVPSKPLKPKGPRNETIKNEITWKTLAWFGWCCLCIGIGIGGYISLNS